MVRCPPGMVCFPNRFELFSSPTLILIIIIGIVVVLVILSQKVSPSVIVFPEASQKHVIQSGDDRYTRAPEPRRDWNSPPDLSQFYWQGHGQGQSVGQSVGQRPEPSFNIPTQGLPEQYQSMGIVKTSDAKLLPLFGRRSLSSRDRYNYYTRTDSYNPIPIPLEIQGRDCQDQVGCPELYNGDKVRIPTLNETGEITIYKVRDIIR
jgi:hypothetical protein